MCGLKPGDLVFSGGNTHIYMNHIEQCEEVLQREPKELCQLKMSGFPNDFKYWSTEQQLDWITAFMEGSDFELIGYESHPTIKGKMAV